MINIDSYRKHLLSTGTKIREAMQQLDRLGRDAIVFITDENERLIGSLTDGDVRRGLLKGFSLDDVVDEIIQRSPKIIRKGERNIDKVIEYRGNNYRIIPILNKDDKVVNVINFREVKSYLPVDVVIMAGGKGKRLRPLTEKTPKPLLKVGNKPIIEHNIDWLSLFGIDDFWISINYLGKQIVDFIGRGLKKNITINYIEEDKPLGTIGAVSQVNDFQHDYILVTNSDILTNLNYEHFFLDFIKQDADFAVVTIPYQVSVPYAVLETSNGYVVSFKEKPKYTYYSNGGIYLMKKEVLDYIPQNVFYNATDLMEKLILNKKRVVSYPLQGYWLDIGKHEDFEKAKKDIERISFE